MVKSTLCFFTLFLGRFVISQNAAERFQTYRVVPDIIDVAPNAFVNVTYPNTGPITFGRVVRSDDVSVQPQVTWQAEPNALYTLIMVDPDAPGARLPTFRSVKHWLVGNIQNNNLQAGSVVAPYATPRPPARTGNHRYVFLLYRQSGNGTTIYSEPFYRKGFNVRSFMQKYNLGNPVAGNMFQSQF